MTLKSIITIAAAGGVALLLSQSSTGEQSTVQRGDSVQTDSGTETVQSVKKSDNGSVQAVTDTRTEPHTGDKEIKVTTTKHPDNIDKVGGSQFSAKGDTYWTTAQEKAQHVAQNAKHIGNRINPVAGRLTR